MREDHQICDSDNLKISGILSQNTVQAALCIQIYVHKTILSIASQSQDRPPK